MYFQDSVMDYRVESDNCISEPSVDNDKRIALAINPYDYYNNRFSEGDNGHSAKQTKSTVNELEQKANFLQENTKVGKNSLEVCLGHYKRAENTFTGNGFQTENSPVCIPLNVDGSISLISSENNSVYQGYTKLYDVVSKSDSKREDPLETKSQNGLSDRNSIKQKIDEEAIMDLAANKYNRWNHTIHDYLWCPFVLFFVFFCCAPAVLLMQKSDTAFRKGRDSEARRCAMCSSVMYGIGMFLSLAFYAMIFALVIIFAKY
ncbi:hypothetical protein ACJMK2_006654 [Sinanodonta woodiana]|uniref:Uncharacterized protein n=1 Tax=Sinanodonta woodiana TaxID=1069815 RepID=A0ABD3VU87_SINWO